MVRQRSTIPDTLTDEIQEAQGHLQAGENYEQRTAPSYGVLGLPLEAEGPLSWEIRRLGHPVTLADPTFSTF